ncbi:MAG: hypothetical protein KC503_17300 [Myxococcales bacterium]|nr:hypothetical protein [Myxococcales bacterium]
MAISLGVDFDGNIVASNERAALLGEAMAETVAQQLSAAINAPAIATRGDFLRAAMSIDGVIDAEIVDPPHHGITGAVDLRIRVHGGPQDARNTAAQLQSVLNGRTPVGATVHLTVDYGNRGAGGGVTRTVVG